MARYRSPKSMRRRIEQCASVPRHWIVTFPHDADRVVRHVFLQDKYSGVCSRKEAERLAKKEARRMYHSGCKRLPKGATVTPVEPEGPFYW